MRRQRAPLMGAARRSVERLRKLVRHVEIDDPVHRVRTAGAAPAVRIERHGCEAADAQPLLPRGSLRLGCAVGRMAEHVFGKEQSPGHGRCLCCFSPAFVFCWSKVNFGKTHGLLKATPPCGRRAPIARYPAGSKTVNTSGRNDFLHLRVTNTAHGTISLRGGSERTATHNAQRHKTSARNYGPARAKLEPARESPRNC